MAIEHYRRFMTRWAGERRLKKEGVAVILSPHIDDAFLSLYEHIVSGSLGENIVCINFFTTTDSAVSTNSALKFKSIAATSIARTKEELAFAEHLQKRGINYAPSFMGFKDAALSNYYGFIASRAAAKLSSTHKMFSRQINARYATLGMQALVDGLISEYRGAIRYMLIPMGLGEHIDHLIVNKSHQTPEMDFKIGLYCDIPYAYYAGYNTLEKLKKHVAPRFRKPSSKKFDASTKLGIFREIYASQFNERAATAIREAANSTGEVIFWRE